MPTVLGLLKARHQLDMRGIEELIDRRYAHQAVATLDEDVGIAREGRSITRDCDHHWDG